MKKKKSKEICSKLVDYVISALCGIIISGIWKFVVNFFLKENNGQTCLWIFFFIIAIIEGILIKKVCLCFENCNKDIKKSGKSIRGMNLGESCVTVKES